MRYVHQIGIMLLALALSFTVCLIGAVDAADREESAVQPAPARTQFQPRIVAPHANAAVQLASNSFSPDSITIHVGDTVTWTRVDGTHNVKADDGSFRLGEPPTGDPGGTWVTASHTFSQAGTFRYYCELHGQPNGGGMAGVIIVQASAPANSLYLPLVLN